MFPPLITRLKRAFFAKHRGWVGAFLWLASLSVAVAQTTTQPFFIRLWHTDDGLPQSAIPAVLQTRDGFLWICTYDGLVRFDGQHFQIFNEFNTPGLVDSRVTSLFEDADGNSYIGHETGNLTFCSHGKFQPVRFHAAWRNRNIENINTDEHGDIWLQNTDQQLARLKDGKVMTPPNGGLFNYGSLVKGDQGRLWVVNAGRVSVMKDGALMPMVFDGVSPATIIQGIAPSRKGGLWVVFEGRIRRWEKNRWVEDLGPAPWGYGFLHTFIEMRDGYLAATTFDQAGQGLYLVSPKGDATLLNRSNKLSSDWLLCLSEDREGNLWVGSGNSGLAMVRHSEITNVNPPDDWQGRGVLSICSGRSNDLWIGTEGAGLYRLQAGKWEHYGEQDGLSNMYVWSVVEDGRGRLWVGTWGGGLFEKEGGHFKSVQASANYQITALLPSKSGGLWIGTGTGLMKLQDDGRIDCFWKNINDDQSQVRAVVEDQMNRVWFGMSGGGLGLLDQGIYRQFFKSNGMSSDFINCLYVDSDNVLWIGTAGGGLERLKNGHFDSITTKEGLPDNNVCDIEYDGAGCFWIGTGGGIVRASKVSLVDCMDRRVGSLNCRTYSKADGMPVIGCSNGFQPASCQTANHRLWFPTSRGLVSIDLYNVKTNLLAPPVVIEQLRVDGSAVELDDRTAPLQIPPGHHRIEFSYAGLSFTAPDNVCFQFKLEGLENNWVNAETARTATFNDIPPGKYIFHVIACNNDGIWNETGATFPFAILPYYWQTLWFKSAAYFLGALLVSVVVWLDTRRRLHRKLEQAEHLGAIERERNRIAMDIHDHLGARLTQISYLCQIIRKKIREPELAILSLDNLHTTIRMVTREMDEIVWAVNPQNDTLDSLVTYFSKFAQEFFRPADIRCRLNFPLQLPVWHLRAEIRHNMFLSFKEALNNVLKHSAATQVDISLVVEPSRLQLVVEDNGRGFIYGPKAVAVSPQLDRLSQGSGLHSMRQRLNEMGGHFNIQSVLGKGTKVIFTIKK